MVVHAYTVYILDDFVMFCSISSFLKIYSVCMTWKLLSGIDILRRNQMMTICCQGNKLAFSFNNLLRWYFKRLSRISDSKKCEQFYVETEIALAVSFNFNFALINLIVYHFYCLTCKLLRSAITRTLFELFFSRKKSVQAEHNKTKAISIERAFY